MKNAMALVNCPECQRQVSTSATTCPGCGHPLRPSSTAGPGLLGKLAAVLGVWLVAPWAARLLAFLAACVVAVIVVLSSR